MFNLDRMGQWLVLAVVAYGAFMIGRAIGRASAAAGSPESRRMADEEEIAAATASLTPSVWAEVDRLLGEKKKIEAIKVLREASGLGLKLSKDAVERRAKMN